MEFKGGRKLSGVNLDVIDNVDKSRDRIKRGLLNQLSADGVDGEHYTDMIDKYLTMWDMAQALEKDFREEGVKIFSNTGSKINPSVPEYARTNNQMLRLLSELGLKPVRQEPEDNEGY